MWVKKVILIINVIFSLNIFCIQLCIIHDFNNYIIHIFESLNTLWLMRIKYTYVN